MKNSMWLAGELFALLLLFDSGALLAQKMEQPSGYDPGDVVIYNWTLNSKSQLMEIEWTGVAGDDVVGVARAGGKGRGSLNQERRFKAHLPGCACRTPPAGSTVTLCRAA
jgi:hypothetical protein